MAWSRLFLDEAKLRQPFFIIAVVEAANVGNIVAFQYAVEATLQPGLAASGSLVEIVVKLAAQVLPVHGQVDAMIPDEIVFLLGILGPWSAWLTGLGETVAIGSW